VRGGGDVDTAVWICIFLPIFVVLYYEYIERRAERQRHILKRMRAHKMKGGVDMGEVISQFIGRECIISTMNTNVTGIIESVEDGWIVLKSTEGKKGGLEILSIEYVSRIREYPRNKNGKRKIVVT
jgi:hypothetical protein